MDAASEKDTRDAFGRRYGDYDDPGATKMCASIFEIPSPIQLFSYPLKRCSMCSCGAFDNESIGFGQHKSQRLDQLDEGYRRSLLRIRRQGPIARLAQDVCKTVQC
jgi:hypothetical protein